LNIKAEVRTPTKDGVTALHFASRNGYELIVKLLVDYGVNISGRDTDGDTDLSDASLNEQESVVKLLLAKGADISATDQNGWNARRKESRKFAG